MQRAIVAAAVAFMGACSSTALPGDDVKGAQGGGNANANPVPHVDTRGECSILAARVLLEQGVLTYTGNTRDVAINGPGMFVVEAAGGQQLFTRHGRFSTEAESTWVHSLSGHKLLGRRVDAEGKLVNEIAPLKMHFGMLAPRRTSRITLIGNLDSRANTPPIAWDAQNPSNTSNFSTSISVYDSLGSERKQTVYFRKTGANAWDYKVLANGAEMSPAAPGTNVEIGAGAMGFNASGGLQTLSVGLPIAANFAGAAAFQTIAANVGTPVTATPSGTGLDGLTQYASPSSIVKQSQDGYAASDLVDISVDMNGEVNGNYTNGVRALLGQFVIAKFPAVDQLQWTGKSHLFTPTAKAGLVDIGSPLSNGRGSVAQGFLESLTTPSCSNP